MASVGLLKNRRKLIRSIKIISTTDRIIGGGRGDVHFYF